MGPQLFKSHCEWGKGNGGLALTNFEICELTRLYGLRNANVSSGCEFLCYFITVQEFFGDGQIVGYGSSQKQ